MSSSSLLSDEAFLRLPAVPGKQELLDGELIELPPAKHSLSALAKRLVRLLTAVLQDSRVWTEAAYWLERGRWLVPDVSVSWPDQAVFDDWFQRSPMIAIENVSRGNTAEELELKTARYLEHGAAEVWVIYPRTGRMVVNSPSGARHLGQGETYFCELLGLDVPADHWQ